VKLFLLEPHFYQFFPKETQGNQIFSELVARKKGFQ
jgi:hypothetical protein